MVIFIFRFWKPEMVCSPDGREDESIWEPTYCELPLFTTLHTLAAGQMSPVNTCYSISILVCLIPLRKFQWPAILNAYIFFSWILDLPPLLAAWLFWWSKTVHFSCLHYQWESRCRTRKRGQVFKDWRGSHRVHFAHWIVRLTENKATKWRTFDSYYS